MTTMMPQMLSTVAPRAFLLSALLAAVGCASTRSVAESPAPSTTVRVHAAPELLGDGKSRRGGLIVGWYAADELARVRDGLFPPATLFADVLRRSRAQADVTFADGPVEIGLGPVPSGGRVFAVFDHAHRLWDTLFGGPGGGNWVGTAEVSGGARQRVDLTLDRVRDSAEPPEPCRGERRELVVLDAPEVAGAVGNNPERRLCVVLPPSYATSPDRRYPVVYLLPGYSGNHVVRLRGPKSAVPVADRFAESGREVILVGVDSTTKTGTSYFIDSPRTGDWDRFIQRVPGEIDARYRTVADRDGRALMGKSTGGFTAMSVGIRHPELFSVIAASAPDALDFRNWLVNSDGQVHPLWLSWIRIEAATRGGGQFLSYAADWSPTPDGRGYALPVDIDSGAVRGDVLEQWHAHSPMALLEDPKTARRFKASYNSRVFINCGREDEFLLYPPARAFSERLGALGVEHVFEAPPGGHFDTDIIPDAVAFAIETLTEHRP